MNNRVANCQLEDILRGENYGVECDEWNDTNIHDMANDLLDARIRAEATEQATKEARSIIEKQEAKCNSLLADKQKLYGWVDAANFKKNEYLARAEKAETLIKEMREQLSAVVSTASTPTTKGELVYVNNYIEMRELLNKSKEYT